MRHYNIILTITTCLCFGISLYSQELENNTAVRTALDSLVIDLDKTKVPTGLLRDFAFELIDFDANDGQHPYDTNYMDANNFELLLRSIRSAAVLSPPFKSVTEIMNDMRAAYNENSIPIGLALFDYNFIKENAISDNLLIYQDNKVYDTYSDGEWINPYGTKTVFGFSPAYNIVKNGTQTFNFSSFAFTNLNIKELQFDPGDGSGYRTVSQQLSASYIEGEYTLKMKITLNDNRTFEAKSKILVTSIIGDYELNGTNGGNLPPKLTIPAGEPYNGVTTSADIFIRYGSSDQQIRKPFIIVEGFDFRAGSNNTNSPDFGISTYADYFENPIINQLQDYDVIYVDWVQNEEYIQANGNLLISLIDYVNQQKALSGSTEENVIYGFSMGGLIARYALCKMEEENRDHQTLFYISHDTPHLGANVPLGALYAIQSIMSFYSGNQISAAISNLLIENASGFNHIALINRYLYSHSARQMLINYVAPNGTLDNSMHISWQNELKDMGFPQGVNGKKCYCKCITNGGLLDLSAYNSHYLYFGAEASGNLLFNVLWSFTTIFTKPIVALLFNGLLGEEVSSFLLYSLGRNSIRGNFKIIPFLTSGCKVFEAELIYTKKFLWIADITRTIFSVSKNAPASFAIDAVNGSYYDLSYLSSTFPSNSSINIDSAFGSGQIEFRMTDKIMFVPTGSSLCIGKGEWPLQAACYKNDYFSDPNYVSETPFCAVLRDSSLYGYSNQHISRIEKMFEWSLIPPLDSIIGPKMPITGDNYDVYPNKNGIQWSTSDATIATIDNNGIIDIRGTGYLTITAEYTHNGHFYSVSKRVMVGLPDYTLSTYKSFIDYSVIVQANPILDENEDFELPEDIIYQWGTMSNGVINWTPMNSYKATTMTNVYFRAVYRDYVSDVYSVLVIPPGRPVIFPTQLSLPVLNVTDKGQIIDTSIQEELATLKSETETDTTIEYTFEIDGYKFHFTNYPTSRTLLQEILKIEYFKNRIKQIKPWGTEECLILKVKYSTSYDTKGETLLKFIFNENL